MELVEVGMMIIVSLVSLFIGKYLFGRQNVDMNKLKQISDLERKVLNAKMGYLQRHIDTLEKMLEKYRKMEEVESEESEEEKEDFLTPIKKVWEGLPSPVKLGINMYAKNRLGMSVDELLNDSSKLEYLINEIAPKIVPVAVSRAVEQPPKKVIDLNKPITQKDLEEFIKANWGS